MIPHEGVELLQLGQRARAGGPGCGRRAGRLAKNPRRDPLGIGFGSYQITDSRTGEVVASFGWDDRPGAFDRLAEAEAWLLRKDR